MFIDHKKGFVFAPPPPPHEFLWAYTADEV
jgi:hypothetical protein